MGGGRADARYTGSVTVSYHPVTDDVTKRPRFASGPTNDVITIEDCTTTLLFPFVTNQAGFDTGLAITNTSEGSGSCTISFHGPDAPDDYDAPISGAREQWILLLSIRPPNSRAISLQAVHFGMRTALPSSPTAMAESPPWRRVISRCARIATRKAHRVAALRVRK